PSVYDSVWQPSCLEFCHCVAFQLQVVCLAAHWLGSVYLYSCLDSVCCSLLSGILSVWQPFLSGILSVRSPSPVWNSVSSPSVSFCNLFLSEILSDGNLPVWNSVYLAALSV
ncbi:hypothetical protein AVEN_270015-1, partial [Araneus ventricosus]